MPVIPFEKLSYRSQLKLMQQPGRDAVALFPVDVRQFKICNHGFNTTFRVDTKTGERFALRLNVNSRKTAAELNAEVSWVQSLGDVYPGMVPTPQKGVNGELIQYVVSPVNGEKMPAVLYSWLPGRSVSLKPSSKEALAFGKTLGRLHEHAKDWQIPAGCEIKSLQDCLHGTPWNLDGIEGEDLFARVRSEADALILRLKSEQAIFPCHVDLHPWNVKYFGGNVSAFDFDDMLLSNPAIDLSVTMFYFRRSKIHGQIQENILKGLGHKLLENLGVTPAEFELLIASRAMFLLSDIVFSTNADLLEYVPKFHHKMLHILNSYYKTGVFDYHIDYPEYQKPPTKG